MQAAGYGGAKVKAIAKINLYIFLIIMASLWAFFSLEQHGYEFDTIENGTGFALIPDGTFVAYKEEGADNLEPSDIIVVDVDGENRIARIVSGKDEEGKIGIIYHEFDKSMPIDSSLCQKKLMFHINEAGAIWKGTLSPHRNYIFPAPFLFLFLSFLFFAIHFIIIGNEDMEFAWEELKESEREPEFGEFITTTKGCQEVYDMVEYKKDGYTGITFEIKGLKKGKMGIIHNWKSNS